MHRHQLQPGRCLPCLRTLPFALLFCVYGKLSIKSLSLRIHSGHTDFRPGVRWEVVATRRGTLSPCSSGTRLDPERCRCPQPWGLLGGLAPRVPTHSQPGEQGPAEGQNRSPWLSIVLQFWPPGQPGDQTEGVTRMQDFQC